MSRRKKNQKEKKVKGERCNSLHEIYIYLYEARSSHSPHCSHEAIDFVINLKPAAYQHLSQMGHFPQIVSLRWPGALQLGRHPSQSWWRPSQPPWPHLSIQPPPYPTLTPPHTSPPLLLTAGDNSSKGFNCDFDAFPPPTPLTPKPPRSPLHHRPGLESMSDRVTLTDYEARRLLNAIVKEFVQMTAEELEQQATEGNRYADDNRSFILILFLEQFSSLCRNS